MFFLFTYLSVRQLNHKNPFYNNLRWLRAEKMAIQISKLIISLFGLFLVFVGVLMFFRPQLSRNILRKFASTDLINYTEISIRLIIGIALINGAQHCKSPIAFKLLGWFMSITAIILSMVPRNLHYKFSTKSAEILKPTYFRVISPFAILFGGLILYNLDFF